MIVTKTVSFLPAKAIANKSAKAEALKCNLCWGDAVGPNCVRVCPANALHLVTGESFKKMLKQKQQAIFVDML